MPRSRFHSLPEPRRKRLLTAAGDEFARYGLHDASIARILEAADASKGGLYYWFEDKTDLFVTVIGRELAPLGAALGKPGPVGSADGYWAAIAGMIDRGWGFLAENERAHALLRALVRAHGAGDLTDAWPRLIGPFREVATEVVLQGQAVGAVRDDLPTGLLIALLIGVGEAADLFFSDEVADMDPDEVIACVEALHDVLRRIAEPT